MAFFGSADSDQLVKQLRGQLAQKDFEIQTLINEQAKKDELFSETKRAKDDAMYKAQTEQERALKSERALAKSNAELQNANMRLANLESTLNDAQNRHKKDEKEIDRLQYELDTRADSAAANARVQTTVNNLKEEIKHLKSELQRSEFAKETLENQARMGGSGGVFSGGGFGGHGGNGQERSTIISLEGELQALRRENLRLMEQDRSSGSAMTPVRPRMQTSFHPSPTPRSKRALSFSGGASHNKIQALEAEVENLRSQAMPGLDMKDVEKLRTDLETAKRHAMKMENEKLAVERSIQREMEDIKSKLSDANDELNYLRAFDGQSVQQQLDVTKKSAKQEQAALEEQLRKRSDELEQRKMDVVRLEGRLRELEIDSEGRQAEIKALEKQVQATQKSSTANADLEAMRMTISNLQIDLADRMTECKSARERIANLEAKLETASSATVITPITAPNDAQAAKIKRAHQREVDDLRRAKETLERHLAESEELVAEREMEIFELKRHMPLPGEQTEDQDVITTSMTSEEMIKLRADLQVKAEQIDSLSQEKEEIESDLRSVRQELAKAQSDHSACGTTIESLRDQIASKSEELVKLNARSDSLSSELNAHQEEIDTLRTNSQGQDTSYTALKAQLSTMEEELDSLREASTHNKSLQLEIEDLKDSLKGLKLQAAQIDDVEASLERSQDLLKSVTQEKETLTVEVSETKRELEDIQIALTEATSATKKLVADKQALIEKKQREADSNAAEAKRKELANEELRGQMEELQNQLEDSDAEMCRLQEAISKSAHLMEQYDGQTLRAERDSALVAQKQAQAELSDLRLQHMTLVNEKSGLEATTHGLTEDIATLRDEVEECQRLLSFADIEHGILEKALTAAQAGQSISEAQTIRLAEKLKETEELLTESEESARSEQRQGQVELSKLRDDHAALQLEHEDLIDGKRQLELSLEGMTADLQRKETELQTARVQLEKLATSSHDDALVDLHRRTQELEARVARRNQLIATEQAKLKKVEMNLDIATEDIEELEAEIARLNGENAQLTEQARLLEADNIKQQAELAGELQTLRQEIFTSKEREIQLQSSLDGQSQELTLLIEQLAQSANDVQAVMQRATDQEDGLRREFEAQKETARTQARQEVEQLELIITNLESKHTTTQSSFDELVIQMSDSSRELDSLRQSREAAEERLQAETRKGEEVARQLTDSAIEAEAQALDRQQERDRMQSENDNLTTSVKDIERKLEIQTKALRHAEESLASTDLIAKALERRLQAGIQDDAGARTALQQELDIAKAESASLAVKNEVLSTQIQQVRESYELYVTATKANQEESDAAKVANSTRLAEAQEAHAKALALLEERSQAIRAAEEHHTILTVKLDDADRASATLQSKMIVSEERCAKLEQDLHVIMAELETLKANLSAQSLLNSELEKQRATAESKMDDLRRQIETQLIADEQLNKSLAEYSRDRFQALAENDQLRQIQNSLESQLEEQVQAVQTLQNESARAAAKIVQLELAVQAKTEEATVATGRYQKAHGLASALTADATRLETKLQEVAKKLAISEERVEALMRERESLQTSSQTYKDDATRLEQSLDGMQTELEEQMAQVKNINKAKALLQRKVEKLERKIKTMGGAIPPSEVPATVLAPHPAGQNQDALRLSPGTLAGQKRSRDNDTAPKKAISMAEAIIAPSPFEITRTPAKRMDSSGKLGFTPTRHNMTPNMGAIPRSPYGRLHNGDENAFPAMAFMRGKIATSVLNQHATGL